MTSKPAAAAAAAAVAPTTEASPDEKLAAQKHNARKALPYLAFGTLGALAGCVYVATSNWLAETGYVVTLPLNFHAEGFDQDKDLHDLFKELSPFSSSNEKCYLEAARHTDNLLYLEKRLRQSEKEVLNGKMLTGPNAAVLKVRPEPGDYLDAKTCRDRVSLELLGLYSESQKFNPRHSLKVKMYRTAIVARLALHVAEVGRLCRRFPL